MYNGRKIQLSMDDSETVAQIAALRRQLQLDAAAWPKTADALLSDLDQITFSEHILDDNMLTYMVHEALQGVDIPAQYPLFYRQLLVDAQLRNEFLDLLTALETEADDIYPAMPPLDLSFLSAPSPQSPPVAYVKAEKKNVWQVTWELVQSYLNQQLTPALGLRSDSLLDDRSVLLLSDEFEVAGEAWEMTLEGVPDEAGQMGLFLLAMPVSDVVVMPTVAVTVVWGDYVATAVTDELGQAEFPALLVDEAMLAHGLALQMAIRV